MRNPGAEGVECLTVLLGSSASCTKLAAVLNSELADQNILGTKTSQDLKKFFQHICVCVCEQKKNGKNDQLCSRQQTVSGCDFVRKKIRKGGEGD